MKRARPMMKPTGRKPMRIGALLLQEVPYKDECRIIDVTWRGANTPSGRGHKTFHNWRHALEFAEKENKRLEALKEKGAGRYTGNDACDSYVKEKELLSKAKDNTGCTRDTFIILEGVVRNHLRPKFGPMRLTEITSSKIRHWVIELCEKFEPRTVKHIYGELNRVLNHAVGCDPPMLSVNPLTVQKVKVPGKFEKRAKIPARSDLEALREYINGPRPLKVGRLSWSCVRMIVLLAVSCGLRAGEASALTWDDIDPDTGEISIEKARAANQGLKGPKTPAGKRKIPTTLAARAIINEHAEVYKQFYGKCVGPVLRGSRCKKDHLSAPQISTIFKSTMRACGLVEPGTDKINFTHHAGRHWTASHWLKSTADIQQTKKWIGHQNASMTMDVYGHCLDDPEARAKFERMPDWLIAPVQIDELSALRPEAEPQRALPAPEESFEFGPKVEVQPDCPIDVPDIAKPWVKPFINLLHQQAQHKEGSIAAAYDWLTRQLKNEGHLGNGNPITLHTAYARTADEFKRLKLPSPKSLLARFRAERVLRLHSEKNQALDIADKTGLDASRVHQILRSRHKRNANNPLNRKVDMSANAKHKPQPEHKTQLKLL